MFCLGKVFGDLLVEVCFLIEYDLDSYNYYIVCSSLCGLFSGNGIFFELLVLVLDVVLELFYLCLFGCILWVVLLSLCVFDNLVDVFIVIIVEILYDW